MNKLKYPKKVWLLLIIIFIAGFLRFFNLNWDSHHFFHPDERNIANAVAKIKFFKQMDPEFFAYGSLPIYLYRAIGETLVLLTKNQDWVREWGMITIIGRGVSAFFSTISIILIFLITKILSDKKTGLWATFLAAFTPVLFQTAHYAVTESLLIFWVLLTVLMLIEYVKKFTLGKHLKVGTVMGLALSTKVAAISFMAPIAVAHLLNFQKLQKPFKKFFVKFARYNLKMIFLLITAAVIFSIISPYTYLSWNKFQESMNYESKVVSGEYKVVYILQFEKTFRYLFQAKNLLWQMGPLAVIGAFGIIYLVWLAIKKKDKKLLIFIAFPILYFIYVGSWYTKFVRYMVPIIPFLIISSAIVLADIYKRWRKIGLIIIISVFAVNIFWGLAFFSIYTRESTRIAASRWIFQNIPEGSRILQEHWDEGLPIAVDDRYPRKYDTEQLTIYEPDNSSKLRYYAEKLSNADYIVINSRRLYGTLINLPEKYPLTSLYYKKLFSGELGYQKIAEFTSYPSLFGITINDDKSEESFQVYDHPKVIVFKNNAKLHKNNLSQILSE